MRNGSRVTALMDGETPPRRFTRDTVRLAIAAVLLGITLALLPLGLGLARAAETTHLRISPSAMGSTQSVNMSINKSLLLDLPIDAQEVIVSQPGVANAILRSKRRIVVQSAGAGSTNMFFLDANGRTITVLDVTVKTAVSNVASALRETYARVLPGSRIEVASVVLQNGDGQDVNRIVLSGSASSDEQVQTAISIAAQFAGSADNVASVIAVDGAQQVMLKVTVAEVQREAVKQLGINLNASFDSGNLATGIISTQPLGGSSNVSTSNGGSFGLSGGGFSIDATLRALERHGALRTLAEPMLTALSGQEAEFLAGGEFPIPTAIDANGTVSYEFKEFGVKLKFTPTIKSGGRIGLVVDTSVSEPTIEGGFNAGAITIPATKERQAKTSVELGVGQTLSIGGMMQDTVRTQINRLPGLGDIPVLGALFRSRDYIRNQTELVILVTPYYAQAANMPILPTDEMQFAGDAEAIFLGHIEKVYGVGPQGMRGSYDGSVGFLLD